MSEPERMCSDSDIDNFTSESWQCSLQLPEHFLSVVIIRI